MIYVGKLTAEQALSLEGFKWNDDEYFHPTLNGDGVDYFLSQEEMNGNKNPNFTWVKDLPLIEFIPQPLSDDALPI